MMKQAFLLIVSAILLSGVLVAVSVFVVQASSASDIVYPVTELGGCRNEVECRAFCDKPENRIGVCWDFAIQHNLVSDEEIEGAKQFTKSAVSGGTGWCTSTEECYKYCADVHNLTDCLDFVEENNLIDDPRELDEARRVAAYLNQGGKMPGDCRGKDACFTYCSNAENTVECFNFAKEAGFLNEQDQAEFATFMGLLAKGETPGGCRSKDECESFCAVEANFEECIAFAEKAGFISKDEVAVARKVGSQGGPGGCKSKQACEAYCNNPENLESCFAFGKEHNLLDEDQMKMIQEGTEQIRAALKETPPEVLECLKATVGENIIQDIDAGTLIPGPEVGLRMRSCFEAQGVAAENKTRDCASLPCKEFLSCLESLGGGEATPQGEEHGIPADIQNKVDTCIAEMQQEQQQNQQQQQGEGGQQYQAPQGEQAAPPSSEQYQQQYQGPSEEQIRQQYEQQYQQQYEQQYQEQYQQPPPSSETPKVELGL